MSTDIITDSNRILNGLPQARREDAEQLMQALAESRSQKIRLDSKSHEQFGITASAFRQAVWDLIDCGLANAYWDSISADFCVCLREAL